VNPYHTRRDTVMMMTRGRLVVLGGPLLFLMAAERRAETPSADGAPAHVVR
jgi:hypothetical protein